MVSILKSNPSAAYCDLGKHLQVKEYGLTRSKQRPAAFPALYLNICLQMAPTMGSDQLVPEQELHTKGSILVLFFLNIIKPKAISKKAKRNPVSRHCKSSMAWRGIKTKPTKNRIHNRNRRKTALRKERWR